MSLHSLKAFSVPITPMTLSGQVELHSRGADEESKHQRAQRPSRATHDRGGQEPSLLT